MWVNGVEAQWDLLRIQNTLKNCPTEKGAAGLFLQEFLSSHWLKVTPESIKSPSFEACHTQRARQIPWSKKVLRQGTQILDMGKPPYMGTFSTEP